MRSAAPELLPIFRSRLQADVLATLLLNPAQEYSLTELAHRFGKSLSTLHAEVNRLTEAGLLRRRHVGRSTLIQADPASRVSKPLAELLLLTWGPVHVIAEEFRELEGAERVVIFGSWAARYHEKPGPVPMDLDVLVVGRPNRSSVYDAADRAQQRLGLPVNPVVRSAGTWGSSSDPLVQQIKAGPMAAILIPDDEGSAQPERARGGPDA